MSEDKKSLINLVPDSVDNAVKNITDKPTQNIGTTLADIWYLVFGGISQAAEKRKLKYSYALQEFENELKEKISKIPKYYLCEPDFYLIAQTLEASKYCIEEEELRHMFARLISKSIHWDTKQYVHPSFINIIRQLSSYDAKILMNIYKYIYNSKIDIKINSDELLFSLSSLDRQGLINLNVEEEKVAITIIDNLSDDVFAAITNSPNQDIKNNIAHINLTKLGEIFCKTCLSDNTNNQ